MFNLKSVHINANEPLKLRLFYECLGFESMVENNTVFLSINKKPILIIHETSLPRRNEAGLYYFSIAVYSKKDLAKITNNLINNKIKINLSLNHNLGYSIYINDPEGNGVEFIYKIPEIDLYKSSEDFSLDEISSWSSSRTYKKLPKDSKLVNIHFHMPELEEEISFYKEIFNLKVANRYNSAVFLSNDKNPPVICLNTWLKIKPDKKIKEYPGIFMYEVIISEKIKNDIISEFNTNIIKSPNNILIKVM